jgi:hypothetical protein
MLSTEHQNFIWKAKCRDKSYSVVYHRVCYCTSLVTEPTNTLHWGTTPNCLQYTCYMFRPLTGHYQGVPIARSYKDSAAYKKKAITL